MSRPVCQRLCIDDLCRLGPTLCGQEFCIGCQRAILHDELLCDECAEMCEDFYDSGEDDTIIESGRA